MHFDGASLPAGAPARCRASAHYERISSPRAVLRSERLAGRASGTGLAVGALAVEPDPTEVEPAAAP